MNDFVFRLKHLPNFLCAPFFFCAFVLLIINALTLFSAEGFDTLYSAVSDGVTALFACCSASFVTLNICKNSKKAIAAGFCTFFFDLVLFSLTEVHISFVLGVILAMLFSYVFSKSSLVSAFVICTLISLVTALILGLPYEALFSLLKKLCAVLKGRGALFGAVNNAYSLLLSNNLAELFFHNDYSGTAYSGGRIVSGVLDIFEAQGVAGTNASRYLSGKYFINIFVSSGLFAIIYPRLERKEKEALALCFVLSVLFGDIRLFALFVLIYNPLMYLGFLLLCSLSYFSAYLLDIKLVFFREGSLIELIKYRDKLLYFFLAGIVILSVSYFFERIIISRFDFHSRRVLPYDVKKIISALGGEENIERINDNSVQLKNSNLIDILKLDCEIKGNTAILDCNDLNSLRKYY